MSGKRPQRPEKRSRPLRARTPQRPLAGPERQHLETDRAEQVLHSGKLFLGSLLNVLPGDLFVPSPAGGLDPHGFGSEFNALTPNLRLRFDGLLYATSEAVVALAVIAEKARFRGGTPTLAVGFDTTSRAWAEGLRLDQVANSDWETPEDGWTRPADCFAYPLRACLKSQLFSQTA
jgi:hypothetical protein